MINFKKLLKWIGLVILYLLMQLVAPIIIEIGNVQNKLATNLILILADIITLFLFVYLFRKDLKESKDSFNKSPGTKIIETYRIWLIGLVFMIISNTIIGMIISGIANNEAVNRTVLDKYTIYAIPAMIIIAPIIEEIIFRLSLRKVINNKYLYIITSGILFGLAHVIGTSGLELLYAISYGALGVAFAYIYCKNDSIICSILAHVTHNFLCILIILFL